MVELAKLMQALVTVPEQFKYDTFPWASLVGIRGWNGYNLVVLPEAHTFDVPQSTVFYHLKPPYRIEVYRDLRLTFDVKSLMVIRSARLLISAFVYLALLAGNAAKSNKAEFIKTRARQAMSQARGSSM